MVLQLFSINWKTRKRVDGFIAQAIWKRKYRKHLIIYTEIYIVLYTENYLTYANHPNNPIKISIL